MSVYLSEEAGFYLDEIKKEEDFNLSQFVSSQLINYKKISLTDIPLIEKEIKEKRAKIQYIESEIDSMVSRIEKINRENKKTDAEKEEEIKRLNFEQEMHEFWANITDDLRDEYKQGLKAGKWTGSVEFFKFCKERHNEDKK